MTPPPPSRLIALLLLLGFAGLFLLLPNLPGAAVLVPILLGLLAAEMALHAAAETLRLRDSTCSSVARNSNRFGLKQKRSTCSTQMGKGSSKATT